MMNNQVDGPIEFVSEKKPMHPSIHAVMQFFSCTDLPPNLQEVSRQFNELANYISELPQNPETTVALRKLLEAKDAAVRARIFKDR